ncbi:MAG TPA: hypothetical protein DDW76_03020 [Cyanobacteria bacterium UBA11369]|nr:hypothetical protein [Cyanobacteria bacterium UBA11371]HBE47795.1 hypothetical protein [Cyanobacteria bacterium UBA11369]
MGLVFRAGSKEQVNCRVALSVRFAALCLSNPDFLEPIGMKTVTFFASSFLILTILLQFPRPFS